MSKCRAIFISAPASNQGKTTVAVGLAYLCRQRGLRVRAFKAGPDFLDAMLLVRASGNPVYQLDLWMNGEENCRQLLCEASQQADIIIIEGVMGLFDGSPSSADLAKLFGVPVVAVIDASGMGQTFGAIAKGLAGFDRSVSLAGVLANNVASGRHAELIEQAWPRGVRFLGKVFRNDNATFPRRHLGLTQADEIVDLDDRLGQVAKGLALTDIDRVFSIVDFSAPCTVSAPKLLDGVRIAIARDEAFAFIYQANLDLLNAMGATIEFFSPLADKRLPEADSVYLPGGYPELHLEGLEGNTDMKASLCQHFQNGLPIYAECGGMLYALNSLQEIDGRTGQMLGLLPGRAIMQSRLKSLSYQVANFPEGVLRGHTFHYSSLDVTMAPRNHCTRVSDNSLGEAIYSSNGLTATYVHSYFPSNPTCAASLFK